MPLSSQALSAQDLMSDMDPSVDHVSVFPCALVVRRVQHAMRRAGHDVR